MPVIRSLSRWLSMAGCDDDQQRLFHDCFHNWMSQQHQDLEELVRALDTENPDNDELRRLIQKSVDHFEEYSAVRTELSKLDVPSLFCPAWNTSFENSFLWLGGCRPSLYIRLLYSVSGSDLQAHLSDFLGRSAMGGTLADITASQLADINALHGGVVRNEDRLSNRMACLQEDTADEPLAMIAKNQHKVGEYSPSVGTAMRNHSGALAGVLEEADKLRLETIKELQETLTPVQAADFLVASKKLHLSMHEWGKARGRHVMNGTSAAN